MNKKVLRLPKGITIFHSKRNIISFIDFDLVGIIDDLQLKVALEQSKHLFNPIYLDLKKIKRLLLFLQKAVDFMESRLVKKRKKARCKSAKR